MVGAGALSSIIVDYDGIDYNESIDFNKSIIPILSKKYSVIINNSLD